MPLKVLLFMRYCFFSDFGDPLVNFSILLHFISIINTLLFDRLALNISGFAKDMTKNRWNLFRLVSVIKKQKLLHKSLKHPNSAVVDKTFRFPF